ncbi:hypothetical protein CAL7716_061950 [Calothrix sp. PCC 7716]|nr:hypothetical protein CAL7716_061950 [Calothrix sp. PCC 7716]
MARNKAEFNEWLTQIIDDLNASDSVSIDENQLEAKHWKEIWEIYDQRTEQLRGASTSDRLIIEQEFAIVAQGVLLEASGTSLEEFEIDQEIERLMDKDDD